MGTRDTLEQLEACRDENVRLEADNLKLREQNLRLLAQVDRAVAVAAAEHAAAIRAGEALDSFSRAIAAVRTQSEQSASGGITLGTRLHARYVLSILVEYDV